MKTFVLIALFGFLLPSEADYSAAKVQVYSRTPGDMGKPNILICHVSNFYPPEITIDLLKNGKKMEETSQTDLAFGKDWNYHLTKHARFTPTPGDRFSCEVTHVKKTKQYDWDTDM